MNLGTLIIVGAGEAGVAAAEAASASGCVGRVLLFSEEEHYPYERPPLSKAALHRAVYSESLIRPADWYRNNDITLLCSQRVISVDPHLRHIEIQGSHDCRRESYDSLLIATGSRPRRLPNDGPWIHYLRTRADAARIRAAFRHAASLCVIGAGVIGLEVAATARSLGLTVSVIEPGTRPMARVLSPDISALLSLKHGEAGVSFHFNSGAVDVLPSAKHGVIIRSAHFELRADLCVAGIGAIPNDELARAAGCAVDNGILVDAVGRTSVSGIFAAGDVAAIFHPHLNRTLRVEAWKHAVRHGAHVGGAMLGKTDAYCETPWFWTDQYDLNVQVAGDASACDMTHWRGTTTAIHTRAGRLCGATTINNGRDMRPLIRLLEAQWVGEPSALLDTGTSLASIASRLLATT